MLHSLPFLDDNNCKTWTRQGSLNNDNNVPIWSESTRICSEIDRMKYILSLFALLLVLGHVHGFSRDGLRRSVRKSVRAYSTPQRPYKNFDDMLGQLDCPVLVDFYAQWCGPCKMMQPVLEDIAGRMADKIKVAKVDTDKSPRLGAKYEVEALPTLILFNKGQVVERFIGYMTADELEYAVNGVLTRLANAPSGA